MKPFTAVLLLLATALPARAQFPLESFDGLACRLGESLFHSGMEADAPGNVALTVAVPETGRTHAALLYVPDVPAAAGPRPLVVALHGTAASPPDAAAQIRALWTPTAAAKGALVLAPVASGNSGGWAPDFDTPALACALAEVERRYAVDPARRYLWGFSSGGHYGHAIALANATRFAAYAVNAGALVAFACGAASSTTDCATLLPGVARRIPIQIRTGTNDSPLFTHAQLDEQRFLAAGWTAGTELRRLQFVGRHTVAEGDVQWAWDWFESRSLAD